MELLIETLKNQTESLKVQFIELTRDFAINEFNEFHNLTYQQVNERWGYYDSKYNRYCQSKKSYQMMRTIDAMNYYGLEIHIKVAIQEAIDHYNDSIVKLAVRIVKKGLDIKLLQCTTSHIGRNIETILTDGSKIVKAQTILAEGEINKPHYRYLVK